MADTKAQLTEAFWQLLEKKSYKKITVRDIVDFCQVNRNTFYYHFEGIPDLLRHAVKTFETDLLSDEKVSRSPLLCILPAAEACMKHREAIAHLKASKAWPDVQNMIREICSRASAAYVDSVATRAAGNSSCADAGERAAHGASASGPRAAAPAGNRCLTARDREILIRFFQSVLSGCLLDWMNGDMQENLLSDICRVIELLSDPDCPFSPPSRR